jgi:phage antirepressor YoqD-like protein
MMVKYKGKSLSRGEIAQKYGITPEMLNDWLKEISYKLKIGKRRIIRPKEINLIWEEWGEWDDEIKISSK